MQCSRIPSGGSCVMQCSRILSGGSFLADSASCVPMVNRAPFLEQAVVNEKTDDEATHRRLMLEMAEQANKADELGRIMIAKESELGVLENKLEVRRCTTRCMSWDRTTIQLSWFPDDGFVSVCGHEDWRYINIALLSRLGCMVVPSCMQELRHQGRRYA